MITSIKFCYCSKIDVDGEKDYSCMFFQFTQRAKKILSKEFLDKITLLNKTDESNKPGIECNNENRRVFIRKLDDNLYRIPVKDLDCFLKCLFKYLPAKYQSPEERKKTDCEFY
ncbi:hypothetical protein DRQ09_02045 [candidate division KSB1 bacterium]|nr:MAG: hypothetical protein DRQ09_02045 [candidate division KSB1 bacterium]